MKKRILYWLMIAAPAWGPGCVEANASAQTRARELYHLWRYWWDVSCPDLFLILISALAFVEVVRFCCWLTEKIMPKRLPSYCPHGYTHQHNCHACSVEGKR